MDQPISLKEVYERHLVACIDRQCRQTKEHIDQYRHWLANNRQVSGFSDVWKQLTFALCADKAQGAFIYSRDDQAYLDITGGFGVHLFGHAPAFIKTAIQDQLEKNISLGPVATEAGEVAQLLCTMTHNERCAFFNSGTEAVMVALRLARAATGKSKIVIFEGGYHGTHDSLLAIKQDPFSREAIANVPGITHALVQDTLLLKFGDPESLVFIEKYSGDIAAVLTEPVRSRFPEDVNPEFLHRLQQVCAAHDIAFVLDEVITGFRVANGGAKQLFALDPDLVVYGKIAGGGLPIGIVAGRKKFLDYIDGGNWNFDDATQPTSPMTFVAGTFCHHPLTMATAKAVLQQLLSHRGELQIDLTLKTARLCAQLNEFCERHSIPVRLTSFGSLFRFLVKGKHRVLYHALLKEKVYVWEGRNCFLSLAHGEPEMALLGSRIKKCLVEMKAAGYFPASSPLAYNPGEEACVQGGICVNETLEKEGLQLAFAYCCENIKQGNPAYLQTEIVFADDAAAFEAIARQSLIAQLQLIILYKDGETHLLLRGNKHSFDGWSLTLLFRYLGKCYQSLETGIPLPDNDFVDDITIKQRLGNRTIVESPVYKAEIIQYFLPATACAGIPKGLLFDHLLAAFAIALGEGDHTIGVPVSGQLVSRLLQAVGNYTCQVPVQLSVSPATVPAALMNDVSGQLRKARQSFRHWYSDNPLLTDIVFNLDNLQQGFAFGNKKVTLLPVTDPFTAHAIVCNIISVPEGLHLSLKYKADVSPENMEKLMERFCTIITETAYVPAGS